MMRTLIQYGLGFLILVACTPVHSDTPRLVQEETLAPATFTPLALQVITPTQVTNTPTPIPTQVSFRLRTPTPPDSPTPSITPTATNTLPPSPTRSITPSRTPTASITPEIILVNTSCSFTWFFSPPPANCPLSMPISSAAAYQSMQNGRMIWLQNGLTIYVMFDTPGTPMWMLTPDLFQEGAEVSVAGLSPPAGYFQPQRGFGKFWHDVPSARERLGWAVSPEIGYTALIQTDSVTGTRYISGANGEIFALLGGGERWQRIQ